STARPESVVASVVPVWAVVAVSPAARTLATLALMVPIGVSSFVRRSGVIGDAGLVGVDETSAEAVHLAAEAHDGGVEPGHDGGELGADGLAGGGGVGDEPGAQGLDGLVRELAHVVEVGPEGGGRSTGLRGA